MTLNKLFVGLTIAKLASLPSLAHAQNQAVVNVTVADLRSDPSLAPLGSSDNKEQTQLLFGEPVQVVETRGGWVRVEAVDQPAFRYSKRWEGYPGWLPKSSLRLKVDPSVLSAVVVKKWASVLTAPGGELITRLPLGAHLHVLEEKKGQLKINLLDGRSGWIASGDTAHIGAPPANLRQQILETASLLLGAPYVWGGRSPYDETHRTRLSGMDCSGLVHLSYYVHGVVIPRDAAEQYLKAEKIRREDLRPADLIFSAAPNAPEKIIHVMLYAGEGNVIEAPQTGRPVRKISFKEKTGVALTAVESGQKLKDRVVYFGRLLKD